MKKIRALTGARNPESWEDCFYQDGRKYLPAIGNQSLFENLEQAARKLAEKKGLEFSRFFEDPIDWSDCSLLQSLPCYPEVAFADSTAIGRKYKEGYGLYVHILNSEITGDLAGYLADFAKITGEICVAELGDAQYRTRKSVLGVVLAGTPTASFWGDVWSEVGRNGLRYSTKYYTDQVNEDRLESWIIPSECQIFALVASQDLRKAAEKTGLPVWDFSAVDKWDINNG